MKQNPFELIENRLINIEHLIRSQSRNSTNLTSSYPRERLSTKEEICEHFGLLENELDSLIETNSIPFIRIGSLIRFERLMVVGALNKKSNTKN